MLSRLRRVLRRFLRGDDLRHFEAERIGSVWRLTKDGQSWHVPTRSATGFHWATTFGDRGIRFEAQDLIRTGDCVLDVGACTGEYTLYAAEKVGPSGRVIAFEPDPTFRECLARNVEMRGHAQVQIETFALAAEPSERAFYHLPGTLGGGALDPAYGERYGCETLDRVEVQTLDGFFGDSIPEVAVLEVTVNGGELAVMQGAVKTLERTRHVIFQSEGLEAVIDFLLERGFRVVERGRDPAACCDGSPAAPICLMSRA